MGHRNMAHGGEAAPAHRPSGDGRRRPHRIVILGAGFGGLYTASHLERLLKDREDVEVLLISRDNYFLMTPLLFEACSGQIELSHCSLAVRAFLKTTRFVEASVTGIDLDAREVRVEVIEGEPERYAYDQLVLAMGAQTNIRHIPGSETALTFKTLADAVVLRNHLIERFERADVEDDARRKQAMLTIAIVGGGLVGVELLGELTSFVEEILRYYHRIAPSDVRFVLLQGGSRILPEIHEDLAAHAHRVLDDRPGVEIRVQARVEAIEPGAVVLAGERIQAETIVLAAGVMPNPMLAALPIDQDERGYLRVEATMRSPSRPEVWAIGDCAHIPGPDGRAYPTLAQHALREARQLARNLVSVLNGRSPEPFVYHTLGTMAALGSFQGIGQIMGIRLKGFVAWWVWRSYYLLQMPTWSRRLRIVIDWTAALLSRPDIVKLDLSREASDYLKRTGLHPPQAGASAHAIGALEPKSPTGAQSAQGAQKR